MVLFQYTTQIEFIPLWRNKVLFVYVHIIFKLAPRHYEGTAKAVLVGKLEDYIYTVITLYTGEN